VAQSFLSVKYFTTDKKKKLKIVLIDYSLLVLVKLI